MSVIGRNVRDVEMDKITSGTSQARQRDTDVSKDDDLVSSIRMHGLIHPIIVKEQNDGTYEVVAGQRRFLAHKKLGKATIRACVLDEGISESDAKKISFVENIARKDMNHIDCVNTVQWFMDRYGKTRSVAEELGISTNTVRKYLSIGRLPHEIQNDIQQKKYGTKLALKALNALGGDESVVEVGMLRELTMELKKASTQLQDKVVEIKKREPNTPIQEVVEKAKKRVEVHKFNVEVTSDQYGRIGEFQNRKEYATLERAVEELIGIGLKAADA